MPQPPAGLRHIFMFPVEYFTTGALDGVQWHPEGKSRAGATAP